jgi:hypothetical protein
MIVIHSNLEGSIRQIPNVFKFGILNACFHSLLPNNTLHFSLQYNFVKYYNFIVYTQRD